MKRLRKFFNKRGDIEWNEMVPLLIAVAFLVLIVVVGILMKDKFVGENGLWAGIKNLLRFGK